MSTKNTVGCKVCGGRHFRGDVCNVKAQARYFVAAKQVHHVDAGGSKRFDDQRDSLRELTRLGF